MLQSPIIYLSVTGLHNQYNYELNIKQGLTILHGKNGTGKTTLLHIIANLIEGDLERFFHLAFESIIVRTAAGAEILLYQFSTEDDDTRVEISVNRTFTELMSEEDGPSAELQALLSNHLGGHPVYLPAFRSVLEAITRDRLDQIRTTANSRITEIADEISRRETRHQQAESGGKLRGSALIAARRRNSDLGHKTVLCRQWFGPFVPVIRCPALWEIESRITAELNAAVLEIAESDRLAFSRVFSDVIEAVLYNEDRKPIFDTAFLIGEIGALIDQLESTESDGVEVPEEFGRFTQLLQQNKELFTKNDRSVGRILAIYKDALSQRLETQARTMLRLRLFQGSINDLIKPKSLALHSFQRTPSGTVRSAPRIRLSDGRHAMFSILSSGERHILTLIFSATHMSESDGIVLIDEPELSLHVDWQHSILTELTKQAGDRQIIVCTHAPEIAAEHFDALVPLNPTLWEANIDEVTLDEETYEV